MTDSGGLEEAEPARLKAKLDREPKVRLEAKVIGEKAPRDLVENQKDLRALLAITVAANEASTIEDAMQIALDQICAHTGWPVGHVYLLTGDSKVELAPTAIWHLDDPERFGTFRKAIELTRLLPGVGLPGRVLISGKPAWVMDVTQEADVPQADEAKDAGLTAGFAFPVRVGTEVIGVLEFFADTVPEPPDEKVVALMTRTGAQLGRVIERQREREALQRNEIYFRHLTENALEFITILNRDGTIRYESPYVELTLRYQREDYLGKSAFDFVHPEDLPRVLQAFAGCLQKPGNTPTLLFRFRHKDGSWRVLEGFGNNLLDDPVVAGIIFNSRDITERTQAEEEIRKLNTELERRVIERTAELAAANKELEAFCYSISHDLRAPLRVIDGFSHILLKHYTDKLDAQSQDYLQRVRAATNRMGELIDDLLYLSRVTRGEMRREVVNLSVLAKTIARGLQETQPERQVTFVIADGLIVNGDVRLLRVVLENLLGNAWKFTGGHPRARIEFGVTQRDGNKVYFVRDDGAGFDMAYANKLFGPFQRLHTRAEFEGTGIGLVIVQRIIQRHGGRVWAEGEVERGATFYFTV